MVFIFIILLRNRIYLTEQFFFVVDVNAAEINNRGRSILDYASDSSSEDENTTLGNTWRGYEMDNSDNESIDSQDEDYLK